MTYLVDTNVLLRLANVADVDYAVASDALFELHRRGELAHVTGQIMIEFRNAATRSNQQNGLGLSIPETEAMATRFESRLPLLPDTPAIFPAWKAIVESLAVIGKRVHDARLVAVCHTHQITHLLTFNVANFKGLANFGPGVVIIHPADI